MSSPAVIWKPLRPTVTIRDKWGDPTYLIHDAWNLPPYGTGSPTVEQCTITMSQGQPSECRLVIADPYKLIDTSKVGNGNQVWVQMKRNSSDPFFNIFSGFIKSWEVSRPNAKTLKYIAECFSTQIIMQERIVNFVRTAPRRLDDPLRPFLDDPNMKAWILFKDLLEKTDIIPILGQPALKHTHRPGLVTTTDGSIDKSVNIPISSLTENMVEGRQVADTITEITGSMWGFESGSPDKADVAYLRFPTSQHSGIVIKDRNPEGTFAGNQSFLLASSGWSYVDSIKKEDGFSNRLYSKTGSQSDLTGSTAAEEITLLNGKDIAQQFTVTSSRLRDLSLVVAVTGYGESTSAVNTTPWVPNSIAVAIVNDAGNRPGSQAEFHFQIPVPFSESNTQYQVHFPEDADYKVIKPGDKAWLIQFAKGKVLYGADHPPCGNWLDTHSAGWFHNNGTGGISAQRTVCKRQGQERTPPQTDTASGWFVNTNGPTYTYKFFDTFTHIIMADDQDSIDRYGLSESFIDASYITDAHTMNAFLASALQYTSKPKRTYRVVQCTIPLDTFFRPGMLVSIVDSLAGLPEFRTTIAEVQEVVYDWTSDQEGVNPLGITKCSLTLTGYVDYKEDYIFSNISQFGEVILPPPIPPIDPVPVPPGPPPGPPSPPSPPPPGIPPPSPPTPPPSPPGAEVKLSVQNILADGNDGNVPSNVYDGSLDTRWSKSGLPAWIQLDMGVIKSLHYVKIAWYKGDTRVMGFNIQTSDNASTWTTRFTGSSMGNTTALEMYDFANVDCRYVRINVTSNSVATSLGNYYASITEVELWGIGPANEVPPPPPPSAGGFIDTDGIKIIYALDNSSGKFHKNMKDLNLGSSWGSSTFLAVDADGSGTRQTSGNLTYYAFNAREGSFASGGQNRTLRLDWRSSTGSTICGTSKARSAGTIGRANDTKNCEVTYIFRVRNFISGSDSHFHAALKPRGDGHSGSNECTLQVGGRHPYTQRGRHSQLYSVEYTHPDYDYHNVTFVSPFSSSNFPLIQTNTWFGIKYVLYNVNNNQTVHAEMWIDDNPINASGGFTNNWRKLWVFEHSGSIAPTWAGPNCQARTNMASQVDVAAYNIHEIVPSSTTSSLMTPEELSDLAEYEQVTGEEYPNYIEQIEEVQLVKDPNIVIPDDQIETQQQQEGEGIFRNLELPITEQSFPMGTEDVNSDENLEKASPYFVVVTDATTGVEIEAPKKIIGIKKIRTGRESQKKVKEKDEADDDVPPIPIPTPPPAPADEDEEIIIEFDHFSNTHFPSSHFT